MEFDDSSPPEPEQIWPPPELRSMKSESPVSPPEPTFLGDPDLAWEDQTEKIGRAIDEIRGLSGTGEADQVETEGEDDIETDIDRPGFAVRSMSAGATPMVFRASPASIDTAIRTVEPVGRRVSSGVRRIHEAASGAIAQLWQNIFPAAVADARRTVVVSSARQGDGATQIAGSLALAGTETGAAERIGLVDLNLRRPGVAAALGIANGPGVVDVLEGRATLDQAIQAVTIAGGRTFFAITAGHASGNPLPLLRSRQMQSLLMELRGRFDRTLIDVAAADENPDVQIIAPQTDGVLLVLAAGTTPREVATEVKKRLDLAGAVTLGLVMNRATTRRSNGRKQIA